MMYYILYRPLLKAVTEKEGNYLERHFEKEIQELIDGKREAIQINRDEFNLFRKSWLKCNQHQDIVGEAHFSGNITYRYIPNHDENE